MAFSKTPQQSTYQTKTIELFRQVNNRSNVPTQDEDYLNCFVELITNKELKQQDKVFVKRPGTALYALPVTGSQIRGVHYNQDFTKLYYVVGDTMYIYNIVTNTLSTSIAAFFGTSSGDVGFCDYLYDTGVQVVIATDGTTLKQIDSANTVTACTDPDLPVHVPCPVFLDGYLFILKANTSDLYNSNLNNPLLWTPGDFISAEIGPDLAKKVVKLNNYLVVFGTNTIEYFWDAAVASGSPLQHNDTPVKFNGYLGGLALHGNKSYFVGNNVQGEPDVFVLEDFKMESIGTQSITRFLGNQNLAFTSITGSIIAVCGHVFYLLNAGTYTYVYDLETKLWSRWGRGGSANFPVTFGISCKTLINVKTLIGFDGETGLFAVDEDYYTDDGTLFTVQGVTENTYFDTNNQKTMARLNVWADRVEGDLSVQWSDDDYQTYNTARVIPLNQELPSTQRLGRFRRRAFKWSYSAATPLRIWQFEVDINLGQT